MSDLEALRAENEALKLRVAWLEGELGLVVGYEARAACCRLLRVTPQQADILCALARAYPRHVQRWALEDCSPGFGLPRGSNFIASQVSRIRRHLGRDAIIATAGGYRIGEAACARVLAAIEVSRPSRTREAA